jgi:hypothetical protein
MDGNPMLELNGHDGPVNSISQINDFMIVTGSWDGKYLL